MVQQTHKNSLRDPLSRWNMEYIGILLLSYLLKGDYNLNPQPRTDLGTFIIETQKGMTILKTTHIPYNPFITHFSSFHFLFHYPPYNPNINLRFSTSLPNLPMRAENLLQPKSASPARASSAKIYGVYSGP